MSKYTSTYFRHYILNLLNVQLFVTLISLPIFIAWGLPISLGSILGNVIFSPFLTAHIFLSSLIFVCAFFGIACTPLLWLLDILSKVWLTLLSYTPETLQFGFPALPMPFLVGIALATLVILHTKKHTREQKILRYVLLLTSIIGYAELYRRRYNEIIAIPCFNGHVQLLTTNNQCILVDPGYIGQRISAPSWAEYTLMSTILKTTGHTTIDTIIVFRPTLFTFAALEVLCRKKVVRTVYIPVWHTENQHKLGAAFMTFLRRAHEHNCTVLRFDHAQTIPLVAATPHTAITLSTTQNSYTKNGITFPKASVSGIIDNKPFTFYASSHTQQKI